MASFLSKAKHKIVENGPSGPLSETEARDLSVLAAEFVEVEKAAWRRKAAILIEIRDRRLYRDEYQSFEEFCKEVFDLSRQRAYRLMHSIKAAEIIEKSMLNWAGDVNSGLQIIPSLTEAAVNEIMQLPSDKQAEVAKKLAGRAEVKLAEVKEAVADVKSTTTNGQNSGLSWHLERAMQVGREIAKAARMIRAACTIISESAEGPFLSRMDPRACMKELYKVADEIEAGAPFADCVYCGGEIGKQCGGCDGHGWLTRTEFHAVPDALAANSKIKPKAS